MSDERRLEPGSANGSGSGSHPPVALAPAERASAGASPATLPRPEPDAEVPEEEVDAVALDEEDATAPTPPVQKRSGIPPEGGDARATGRRPRGRMTLRIPDDEISRPNIPVAEEVAAEPVTATRIISINPGPPDPDDETEPFELTPVSQLPKTSVPRIESGESRAGSERPRSHAAQENWTPHESPTADHSVPRPASPGTEASPSTEMRAASGSPSGNGPASVDIPIDADVPPDSDATTEALDLDGADRGLISSMPPPPSTERTPHSVPTVPRLMEARAVSATLIDRMEVEPEGEEVRFDEEEAPRISDPGDAPEVSNEDLVSVESVPAKKLAVAPLPPLAPVPPMRARSPSVGSVPPPISQAKVPPMAPPASGVASTRSPLPNAAPAPASLGAAPTQSSPVLSPPPSSATAPAAQAEAGATQPVASGPAAPAPPAHVPAPPASNPHLQAAPVSSQVAPARPAPLPPTPPLPRPPMAIVSPQLGPQSPLAPPPMTDAAAARKRARPWWEELFNDDFIRTMAKITDPQIAAEADFIEDSLGVAKGAMVLDLACGTGRHAIELTRRGYQVVGFDLSLSMLARAADEAQERNQKLNFVQGDMREMTFEDTFDGVYCWNTSFGFFEEEKNAHVVTKVHKALRKGGQFLLDVANRDFLTKQQPSLAWFEGEGCICMDEMSIDWITSRLKVKRTMMMDDGRSREIEYSIRIYSLHELGRILHEHGFRVAEVSGRTGTPGVFFGGDSPRTLILAEKR